MQDRQGGIVRVTKRLPAYCELLAPDRQMLVIREQEKQRDLSLSHPSAIFAALLMSSNIIINNITPRPSLHKLINIQ